jgi:hypothetical protein
MSGVGTGGVGTGGVGTGGVGTGGVGTGGVGTGGVGTSGVGTGGVGTGGVGTGGVGTGGVGTGGGATAAVSVAEREDELLRRYLANVQLADNANARGLTSLQTASLLYNSGHKRAAKELLCEQREMYDAFRSIGSPCVARADWELMRPRMLGLTASAPTTSSAPTTFRANAYRNRADCLTAAYTAGVPLSACDR